MTVAAMSEHCVYKLPDGGWGAPRIDGRGLAGDRVTTEGKK
jgi:hypothetical protein